MPTVEISSTTINGERLLAFFANHGLALANAVFSTSKIETLHTSNGRGRKHSRHPHETARHKTGTGCYITAHLQPSILPFSDHNIVRGHVGLRSRFARNRPLRRVKTDCRSTDDD